MRPLDVHVVALEGNSEVGEELHALLGECPWCSADISHLTLDSVLRIDLPPESVALFVARQPLPLTRAISQLKPRSPDALFAFVNLFQQSRSCLDLLAAGFDNFLSYPFHAEDVAARIQSMPLARPILCPPGNGRLADTLTVEVGLRDLIGVSPQFNRVVNEVKVLSRVDATVLITGETGTGKDMCARAIHYASTRRERPFVPVNCGAIPDDLFENELFGHERGAYTDARTRQPGLIELASGGTLFLDEVESVSLSSQVRLLRFLQGSEYTPLGSGRPKKANVRIIAATNADLHKSLRERRFREDLYFRLEVLTLSLPPLRERLDDIPSLANHLVTRFCSTYSMPEVTLTDDALRKLQSHDWPGNVRELENVLHRAIVHSTSGDLTGSDMLLKKGTNSPQQPGDVNPLPFNQARENVLSRFERDYVISLLRLCGGNVTKAAERAGKHRRTFWEIMRRHNLSRSDF